MRIFGILLSYIIGNFFADRDDDTGNITLFFIPAFLSGMQALLFGMHLPESPVELLRMKQPEKAAEAL